MNQDVVKPTKMSSMWYLLGPLSSNCQWYLAQFRICMGLVVDQPCAATPTAIPAPRPPRTRPANATLSRPAFSWNTRPLMSLMSCWCTPDWEWLQYTSPFCISWICLWSLPDSGWCTWQISTRPNSWDIAKCPCHIPERPKHYCCTAATSTTNS